MLVRARWTAAGIVLGGALAIPCRAAAQEIQLTGPLCGAPAGRGPTALITGLELTAASGALVELGPGGVAMPSVGFETRLMVARPWPDKLRVGPALGVSEARDFRAARSLGVADVGWAFERIAFTRGATAFGLSATAGATGRFGDASPTSVALGFHAGATLDVLPDATGFMKARVYGLGVDVRAFDRGPPLTAITLRISWEAPHPDGC